MSEYKEVTQKLGEFIEKILEESASDKKEIISLRETNAAQALQIKLLSNNKKMYETAFDVGLVIFNECIFA